MASPPPQRKRRGAAAAVQWPCRLATAASVEYLTADRGVMTYVENR